MDPVHGRAGADNRIEAEDPLVRMLLLEAAHQVDLRADRPLRLGRSGLDLLDYVFGRSVQICSPHHVEGALRVHDDGNAGVLGPCLFYLFDGESAGYGTVALPEDDFGALKRLGGGSAEWLARVPYDHLIVGVQSHRDGGVAAQMLV